jgi:hypothetical protein
MNGVWEVDDALERWRVLLLNKNGRGNQAEGHAETQEEAHGSFDQV